MQEFGTLQFHHQGIAVPEIQKAIFFYESVLGYKKESEITDDPNLNVSLCLLSLPDSPQSLIELVSPLNEKSPVSNLIRKQITYYHNCYLVDDLKKAIDFLSAHQFLVTVEPTEAILFNKRKVAFLYSAITGLIELLEK